MSPRRLRTSRSLALATVAFGLAGCPGNGMFLGEDGTLLVVPTTARPLYEFLEAGSYQVFDHESSPHQPAGPHRVNVQVYLNSTLVQSLTAGNAQHPRGSAAVKELYDAEGALVGWAVMVKQRDDIPDGTAWFWYETHRGPTKAENPDYLGDGTNACIECHGQGRGFIRIEFPLR